MSLSRSVNNNLQSKSKFSNRGKQGLENLGKFVCLISHPLSQKVPTWLLTKTCLFLKDFDEDVLVEGSGAVVEPVFVEPVKAPVETNAAAPVEVKHCIF